ncbi:MAG: NAD(P)-dependent oxidoreductase [Phycisphaerales bacterium]
MSRPVALVTESIDDACRQWLAERCDLRAVAPTDAGFDAQLATAHALVVRTYTTVDEALLAKAPNLRVVGRAGVGLDNIDLHACRLRDVVVVHTPEANTEAVVEFTVARMLQALRPLREVAQSMPAEQWKRLRDALITPRQASGATLGVLGFGRIGSRVARTARSLGMRVLYTDLDEIPGAAAFGAEPVDRDTLLRESDVLTIHVDGRPENRGLLGARDLGLCKPECAIINTARGFVLDAGAVAVWLLANPKASAWLDVHEPEPIPDDYPLLGLNNAHLTPHIAAATRRAKTNMSWVVQDVWRVLAGEQARWRAV